MNTNTSITPRKVLKQLHINHLVIEKTKTLACESIYWINMNADIEERVKNCPTYLNFQKTQPKDKTISQKIPRRPLEYVRTDIFSSNDKHHLCIVDYHSKCPVMK